MRIILLHYSAPPVVGGVESVLARHARLLADAGHAVTVIAGRGAPFDPRVAFAPLPEADSLDPGVLRVKASLDRGIVPPDFAPLAARLTAALERLAAGADALIAHNVCSLHKNLALTAAVHAWSADAPQARLILWHHDLAWAAERYHPELHPGFPWELLLKPPADAVHVAVSGMRRGELADLLGLPQKRIEVIPNGIDLAAFLKLEVRTQELAGKLGLVSAAPLLLLPVRLTPRKNVELALHVLKALQAHFPAAAMVVTGPPGAHNPENLRYLERLQDLRAGLGLDGAAHFLTELCDRAPLPDAVIADLYRLADLLFLPSREEGFGLPVLEAGLAGLPVFCANLPPLRALADGRAEFFSPDANPVGLAGRIARRLKADRRYRLRVDVRRNYSWERIYADHIAPLLERK